MQHVRTASVPVLLALLASAGGLLPAPGWGPAPAAAQQGAGRPAHPGSDPADTFHLPGIVVTATGQATPRARLPQNITILGGAELRERGVVFLADALAEVPGVQVVRTGSLGGTTSVFMRGGNSNFVKVLLDGVPLNEPGGRFDFGSFTLQNIERIEVVRGPGSVLYGSDAVAGVIQLFTREGEPPGVPAVFSGAVQAGSRGTVMAEAGLRGGSDRARWSLSLGRTDSDGFYPVNNRFTALVGSGRVELSPDERSTVALALRVQESRYHFPTNSAGEISDLNQYTFDDGVALSLEGSRVLAPGLHGRLLVRTGRAERGFEDAPDTPADTLGFGYAGSRLGTSVRRGADARLRWTAARVAVTGGMDWEVERERLQSRTESNFGGGRSVSASAFSRSRWNVAGYGQVEADGPGAVRWSAGGRADRNEVFGTFLTGQAGVVVPLPGAGRLRAAVGSAFKAPTFSQQFAATPFERGNPDLEPETSRNVEGGWDGGFLGNRLVLGAGLFRQDFRNLIEYANRGASLPTYFNESRARSSGGELQARWTFDGGAAFGGEYTRTNARVVTDDADLLVDGEAPRLLRRPEHQVTGRVRVPLPGAPGSGRGSAGLAVTHVGTREDMDFSSWPAERVTLSAYTTVDLDVQVPVSSALLTFRVENLADRDYTSVVGFPGKGRMAFVGVRWNP